MPGLPGDSRPTPSTYAQLVWCRLHGVGQVTYHNLQAIFQARHVGKGGPGTGLPLAEVRAGLLYIPGLSNSCCCMHP